MPRPTAGVHYDPHHGFAIGMGKHFGGLLPESKCEMNPMDPTDSVLQAPQAFLKIRDLAVSMQTLEIHPPVDATFGYNEANRLLYEISTLTRSLEMLQIPASEILQSVQPIRDVLSRSPFIQPRIIKGT
jgi:hypothetical protein